MPLIATVRSRSSFSRLRSFSSALHASSLGHAWLSSMRCLPQKWPAQKPQSPTMRCAAALHSLNWQRGRREALEVAGFAVGFDGVAVAVAGMVESALPVARSSVVSEGRSREESGAASEERWRPACRMRSSDSGRLVRRAIRRRRVPSGVEDGRVSGKAVRRRFVSFSVFSLRACLWDDNESGVAYFRRKRASQRAAVAVPLNLKLGQRRVSLSWAHCRNRLHARRSRKRKSHYSNA